MSFFLIWYLLVFCAIKSPSRLARIFHESPAATTDMAFLPGVLGCRTLRRTVQVRLGTNTLRLPGGTPIFRGLATAIHEISGLEYFWCQRDDFHKSLGSQFARHGSKNTGPYGLTLLIDQALQNYHQNRYKSHPADEFLFWSWPPLLSSRLLVWPWHWGWPLWSRPRWYHRLSSITPAGSAQDLDAIELFGSWVVSG